MKPSPFKIIHRAYNGDEPMNGYGYDFDDAAMNYAEKYDCDEPNCLLDGGPEEIEVTNEAGEMKKFKIFGQADVNYYAEELE